MTCELYRYFDADWRLIYVGISKNAILRATSHSNARWYDMAVWAKIERYPSRAEALAAEDAAILAEKPMFNLNSSERRGMAARSPEKQAIHEAELKEAREKGIKVNKGRGIRWQIDYAERGVKYPYGFEEQIRWERETGQKLHP